MQIVFSSVDKLCPTLQPHGLSMLQASLSSTVSQSLLKFMFTEMPSSHLILCHLLLLLPSVFPSIRSFPMSWLFALGPKVWSFIFSLSHSNEYSGFISFRIDWFDLFAVQRTNIYITTWKTLTFGLLERWSL